MLSTNAIYLNMNDSLARSIKAKVEHYRGSTLVETYSYNDALQNIHVDRISDTGKFFGFGISQKLTLKLTDTHRLITVSKGDKFKLYFSANEGYSFLRVGPQFTADDIKRDEKTNALTIIAFDPTSELSKHTVSELSLASNDEIQYSLQRIAWDLGLSLSFDRSNLGSELQTMHLIYNYTGNETWKDLLDDCAEFVMGVYFFDEDFLCMRPLRAAKEEALTIHKQDYFELTRGDALTIHGIAHHTELGDNLEVGADIIPVIKDNGLLTGRDNIGEVLNWMYEDINGLYMYPYSCTWRGNFALQLGDRVAIEDKNGNIFRVFIINDSYEYNGGFKQTCNWAYEPDKTTSKASTIGEKINQTTAIVDKVNQEITMLVTSVATQNEVLTEKMAELEVNTNNINASVTEVQKHHDDELASVNSRLDTVIKEAALKVDADGVEIIVEKALGEGVDKVVTSGKKYTFDDTGLDISSVGSNISTKITEDGMRIYRAGSEVLIADNEGVKAEDLHATTYLIIGKTSRLEDRGNRTACFWIGEQ